ncbi:hypothetical protein [Roseomonas chloroacetimidivorans]|uniref:hypothetical protein n=1 Tax=Roseomonas chloroacetimidivorans TaxID=1766656 RepID=UPI003C7478FB
MDRPRPIDTAPKSPEAFIWLYLEEGNVILGSWRHVLDENAPTSNNPDRSDYRQGFVAEREPDTILHPTHWAPYIAGEAPPPPPSEIA